MPSRSRRTENRGASGLGALWIRRRVGKERGTTAGRRRCGGFVARPVGFIEISSAGSRFIPIVDFPAIAMATAVAIVLGLLLSRR